MATHEKVVPKSIPITVSPVATFEEPNFLLINGLKNLFYTVVFNNLLNIYYFLDI